MGLRSLHIDAGRSWRGGQRQVLLLARELRARGGEPLVVGARGAPLVERAHAAGLATAAAPMRHEWDVGSARKVRLLVRTWQPDIVHAHDARAHSIALMALAGRRTPLVVTRRVARPPRAARFKYGPRVARFIAISEAAARSLVSGGVDSGRVSVVYSGVPAPPPSDPVDWRAELGWPEEVMVAGVVGAMTAEKGIELLTAIAGTLDPRAARRTRLVLIGGRASGTESFGPVAGYRAGFIADVTPAMAGLDVLWHPATAEALGTSLLDAMALGVPPIAFAIGGIPEIVEDGREGLLVPAGDIAAFGRAHERMFDESFRGRLAEAGPARAARCSVERMTDSIERVYQQVLST